MKFEHEELFNLEDLKVQLIDLRHLLNLHCDYFVLSVEEVKTHPHQLTMPYEQQGALVRAIIDVVDNIQEVIKILIERSERSTAADEKSSATD